jgi:hypothetical protein
MPNIRYRHPKPESRALTLAIHSIIEVSSILTVNRDQAKMTKINPILFV